MRLDAATALVESAVREALGYKPRPITFDDLQRCTIDELCSRIPQVAINMTVGAGKTKLVLDGLPNWIAERRALGLPHRVHIALPEHKLSVEMLERAQELGLKAGVFRGMGYKVTETKRMCARYSEVSDSLHVGVNVTKQECGPADPGKPHCPHRFECPWWEQQPDCAGADVLITAHEFLWFGLPAKIAKDIGLVIVDEGFWRSGLVVPLKRCSNFQVDGFANSVALAGNLNSARMMRLMELSQAAERGLNAAWAEQCRLALVSGEAVALPAPLRAKHITLTIADVNDALRLEQRRTMVPAIAPGMDAQRRITAVFQARVNAAVRMRREFWLALRETLIAGAPASGRVVVGLDGDRLGVWLYMRRAPRGALAGLPIIHLDASLEMELVQQFFPRMRLGADVVVDCPHQRIVQVLGRTPSGSRPAGNWSQRYLDPGKADDDREARRREKRLRKIAVLCRLSRAGIITHKGLLKHFADVELQGNFGAVRGRNLFQRVPTLVVLGRQLPPPEELLAMARALTGRPIRGAVPVWEDGKLSYADPDVELVRRATCGAEIVQAIGRARGVQRTADCPVTVLLFVSDMVLSFAPDDVKYWEDLEPSLLHEMMANELVLMSPRDALKVLPELFGEGATEATVRQVFHRAGIRAGTDFRDIPQQRYLVGECHGNGGWRRVRYRPHGRGQQVRVAWARDVDAARARIEAAVGPMAVFEVDGDGA